MHPKRFPGFSVLGQAGHWDDATREVVLARTRPPAPMRCLTAAEGPAAVALVARLMDVDDALAVALAASIDARLADDQTDGWHYDDMPVDAETWKRSLAALDEQSAGGRFVELSADEQRELLASVKDGDDPHWYGLPRAHLWNLWMRYASTAYYAHPRAWDEMGWPGPAYPRGYKNSGINAREPFEVADADPRFDPAEPPQQNR